MAPGQTPDIAEALTDDETARHQAWRHGERELVERQTKAAEDTAKQLKRIADALEAQAGGGGEEGGGEAQPKEPK